VPKTTFIPGNYIQIVDFMSPANHQNALSTALGSEHIFKASTTTTKAKDYRKSRILYSRDFPDLSDLMRSQVKEVLPVVLKQMKYDPFEISSIEAQLTAHNDGEFYKKHTDASSEKTKSRVFTYVYYFYKEPKAFSGGELKLYDTEIRGNSYTNRDQFKLIEPMNNSIVFFNSRCKHEVLPISCPSQQFEDSRFTINGWVRRFD
jgi:Rps23 Pro-64 3,4-dihydroxylase Tpa1-like proline 4-hydroxylase